MKKYIAVLLAFTIVLSGCAPAYSEAEPSSKPAPDEDIVQETVPGVKNDSELAESFNGLNDPKLLQYVEDSVYAELVSEFSSEDYIVENVSATYISKEYLEELAYNSQAKYTIIQEEKWS